MTKAKKLAVISILAATFSLYAAGYSTGVAIGIESTNDKRQMATELVVLLQNESLAMDSISQNLHEREDKFFRVQKQFKMYLDTTFYNVKYDTVLYEGDWLPIIELKDTTTSFTKGKWEVVHEIKPIFRPTFKISTNKWKTK